VRPPPFLRKETVRVLASDKKAVELNINDDGKVHRVHKDGTYHLDDATGRMLVKSGDFAQVGANFRGSRGWKCTNPSCRGRVSLFKDSCGKCGGHDLVPE